MTEYFDDITNRIKEYHNIFIYGAGVNANYVYQYLTRKNINISGFVVSEKESNPARYKELPVCSVYDLAEGEYAIIVPFYKFSKNYKDVMNAVIDGGKSNVFFLPDQFLDYIKREYINHLFCKGNFNIVKEHATEQGYGVFSYGEKGNAEGFWRFGYRTFMVKGIEDVYDCFVSRTPMEEHFEQFGNYIELSQLKSHVGNKNSITQIYMATSHLDTKKIGVCRLPEWIVPIQVGAALTETQMCQIKDSEGDNISEKNRNYSECTALYWMWKNAPKTDYIGLCHYRRHLKLSEDMLGYMAGNDIDIVVTRPSFEPDGNATFFSAMLPQSDFDFLSRAIDLLFPEYTEQTKRFMTSRYYIPCNLFVMKYQLFQEFAHFIFTITFEIERLYERFHIYRSDRYMGYIVECLLNIFIMKHKEDFKVAYTDMEYLV